MCIEHLCHTKVIQKIEEITETNSVNFKVIIVLETVLSYFEPKCASIFKHMIRH